MSANLYRNSSFELLRIMCMLFILIHHILVHSLHLVAGYSDGYNSLFYTIIDSYLFVAVNVFVLISGYHGIKFQVKGIIRLYSYCFSYALLIYLLHLYLDSQNIGKSLLFNSVFCISNANGVWFIKSYFFLYLMSPILNSSINSIDKKMHGKIIILLSLINLYFGFYWGDSVNSDGYNLMNFIYIYFIGRYLFLYGINFRSSFSNKNNISLICYLSIGLVYGLIAYYSNLLSNIDSSISKVWAYNNPILLFLSICFFVFFSKFRFYKKSINYIATSVFSVYLIHENSYISPKLYAYIYDLSCLFEFHSFLLFIYIIIFALVIFIVCVLFDKVYSFFFIKYLEKVLNFGGKKILQLINEFKRKACV